MGKYRPFILLGIAVIVAFVAALLILNYLQTKAKPKEVTQTHPVVVAKVDLPWGTSITQEMVETKPYLKSTLPGGCISDPSSIQGRILISPVKANEPIFESKLAPTSVKMGGVAAVISPGKRAVAVKVDKVIGVAGFIHPGNRVDVMVTVPTGKAGASITKTVLENMLVLAVGPEIEGKKGKEEKPSPVDVITLEVTPEEAEKLALAATEGRVQLALRNFTDTEDVLTKGTTIPVLLASYSSYGMPVEGKVAEKKAVPAKRSFEPARYRSQTPQARKSESEKPQKSYFIVELIKANKVSELKFEGSE
jgi:pilus assembly protein CpaB